MIRLNYKSTLTGSLALNDTHDLSKDIQSRHLYACNLARQAGTEALAFFNQRDALIIEAKENPQDVVSRADREVEVLIRKAISNRFSDDAIIGEEAAPTNGTSGFTWVIDPIDGTMPFLSGLPQWCVAIALTHKGRTVAAATYAPVLETLYEARLGAGFYINGKPHKVSDALTLTDAMSAIGASHRCSPAHVGQVIEKLLKAGGAFYRNGSGAMMLATVASGQLAGYYEPHMNAWDCLGGLLMIEEAGGQTLAYDTTALLANGGRVLGAAPQAFDAFLNVCSPE